VRQGEQGLDRIVCFRDCSVNVLILDSVSVNKSTLWSLLTSAAGSVRSSGDPTWETLRAAYAYDAAAPLTVTEEVRPDPEHSLSRLTLTRRGGHQVSGLFIRPTGDGQHPCVLLLHALSSDKEEMVRLFGRALASRGVACLALDAHLHGERKADTSEQLGPLEYLDLARESIVEYRQALDYLATRPDVDAGRVGLLGYSLGAMMGTILAGVDERVMACVLVVGGDVIRDNRQHVPAFLHGMLEPVSPVNFVGHISPRPVFFLNGRWDTTVPRSAATLLHEAAGEPKEVLWADAGHILPAEVAAKGVEWLAEQLQPR
jgi:uncharacterized protein